MVGVISLSIVLIFLIHQVYEYLKLSFSKPLERNIVNETKSHYEQIYNTLATTRNQMEKPIQMPTEMYSAPPQQPNPPETMANELMNFMSDLDNAELPPTEVNIHPYEQELDGVSTF
jgi:hypothetical protein